MGQPRFCRRILLISLLVSCCSVWAQNTAQITGKVTDPSGAAIPDAQITATQTDTNVVRTTSSGADGSYVLADLPIGPYNVDVNKDGFNHYKQAGVVLQVASNVTVDVALKVGNVAEQVVVEGNAVQVDTQATGIGQVIDNQRVLELPLTARNSQQLILIAGGSVGGGTQATNRSYPVNLISVAGSQTNAVTYILDGGTHNEPYLSSAMPVPFPDALQEFKVDTSSVPAQYGSHAGGAIQMVTKSGTNQFHGTAFEFLRNGDLNARNTFASTVDQLKRNQFGGVIGGPIKKDKLFFFFGDQYTKTVSVPTVTVANVITQQMLQGDWTTVMGLQCRSSVLNLKAPFVNNQIDPSLFAAPAVALTQQKNWVIPSNPCGIDTFTQSANSDEQMIVGKVDYVMNSRNTLFVRPDAAILHQPTSFTGTDVLSLTQPDITRHAYSLVVGDTYIINNSTVASFRATGLRTSNVKSLAGNFTLPQLGVQGLYYPGQWAQEPQAQITVTGAFTLDSGLVTPGFSNTTVFQESGAISMTRGAHQISFGADFMRSHIAQTQGTNAPGMFTFNANNTGSALGDFMLGKAQTFTQTGLTSVYLNQNNPDMFIQDTWKATRHFTIIGGLRWEPYIAPSTQYHQAGVFTNQWYLAGLHSAAFTNAPAGFLFTGDPGVPFTGNDLGASSWSHFAPRLGIAWDPKGDGKTVVRVSAGKFFDYIHLAAYAGSVQNEPPTGAKIAISGASFTNPWTGVPGGNPFPLISGANAIFPLNSTVFTVNPGMKQPGIWNWNFAVQRQITQRWLVTAAYMGSLAVHQGEGYEGNPGVYIPGNCVAGQYGLTAPGLCTTTANLNQRRFLSVENPAAGQYYSNLQTLDSNGTRSYNGLSLTIERRLATNFTVLANYTWSHCIDYGITTHNSTDITYDLQHRPFDRGNCELDRRQNFNLSAVYQVPRFSNHIARLLATGWQASTVAHITSGPWVSVLAGVDNAGTGTGDEWASFIGSSPYATNRGSGSRIWLNPAAFALPAVGSFGNMAAQNILAPGAVNFDVALARLFRVRERLTMQLRAEAFNVFNHVNPGGATTSNPTPTTTSGIDLTLTDSLFGKLINAADPRIMQVAVKFTF